ncbi:EAL domain-containing protein [Oceaniserpentilla sp. 4NH20-0058]|uniref:EAL domain-containing protein n=1 Tax=Oceaniserpentilla sp. 4NH20-0058 TaxID=3127660 RepID=UPI00333E8CAC
MLVDRLIKIKKDSVILLLVAFFLFLVAIQFVSFYIQFETGLENRQFLMKNTLSSLAMQTSNSVYAQKNSIPPIITKYEDQIKQLTVAPKASVSLDLMTKELSETLLGYSGYMLLNEQLEVIDKHTTQQFTHQETPLMSFLNNQNKDFKGNIDLFANAKNGNGGVHFIYDLQHYLHIPFKLVVSRQISIYNSIIRTDNFGSFRLVMVDVRNGNIILSAEDFVGLERPTALKDYQYKILSNESVTGTPWEVVAVERPDFLRTEIINLVLPKVFFVALYFLLAFLALRVIRRIQSETGIKVARSQRKSQRAEQALDCIDEVVVTTLQNGCIVFCNHSAEPWLNGTTLDNAIGKPIEQVFPYQGLPWCLDDSDPLINPVDQQGEMLVDIQGRLVTLEVTRHFSKADDKDSLIIWVMRDVSRQAADRDLLNISRSRYRALYNGSGIGMWHVDISLVRRWLEHLKGQTVREYVQDNPDSFAYLRASFHLIDINDAALSIYSGSNKREILGKISELFKLYNKDLMLDIAQKINENKSRFSTEIIFKSLDGKDHHYLLNGTLDTVGKDQALFCFININDRIIAENALKESEHFWSSVIETLPDIVYVNDIETKQSVYNNRHIGELLGYSQEQIENIKDWRSLLHHEDLLSIDPLISKLKEHKPGKVYETNARLRHSDGSWRVVRFRNTIFTSSGEKSFGYYVGLARDITQEEQAKTQLLQSERRYRLLTEGMSDIVFTLDLDLQLTYISTSVTRVLGFNSFSVLTHGLEFVLLQKSHQFMNSVLRIDLNQALTGRRDPRAVRTFDVNAKSNTDDPMILEIQSSILRNESNEIEGILATGRDVTQKRQIEREARTAAEVFENTSESIIVTEANGKISRVNKAFLSISGFQEIEALNKKPTSFLAPSSINKEVVLNVQSSLKKFGYWQGELHYINSRREVRPSWTGITALKTEDGKVQSHIIISSDIAEKKITEARIERLAYFDGLTGLPNRSQMHETLEKLMLNKKQVIALLFIDLDRFKPINDSMGHPVGDQVLKQVANRLSSAIRPKDLVARIGGDEFTVIMSGMRDGDDALLESLEVSERILKQLVLPFKIEDRQLYLSCSIGVAIFPEHAETGMDLLKNADTAMYHAKAMGKNNVQFYAENMNIHAMERLELENNLHLALRRNEFELFYQAQWDTIENKICGIESLIRWRRPEYGIVGPDTFMDVIEETGLIVPIGEWVLRTACEQIIDWQDAGFLVPKLSVNLSARQFKDAHMLDRICRIVDETGVDPELIELELTESILMDDVDRTLAVLNEARSMGFQVSIDDFGTGYSSLSYLKQFPVNNLKIDKSFIRNLPDNLEDAQITRTIVAMANNLGLGVIAEGVEVEAQQHFLQQVGCHKVQGYMYSYPVAADILAHDFLDTEQEALLD